MSEELVILFAFALFIILIPVALLRLRYLRKQGLEGMRQKLAGEKIILIDEKAIFYGQRSRGLLHSRRLGGVFALSENAAHFKTFPYGKWSDFEIVIPRQNFLNVSKEANFLAMNGSVIGGLVVLGFVDDKGEDDEIAFRFDDNEAVMAQMVENREQKIKG